jgi:hypothetical protein
MRASDAPSTPQIRLHPETAAVEVQTLYRGVVIGSRCLTADDATAFLIGCAKGVDAPAAANLLASDAHRLVSRDAGGFAVELTDQMTGTVIFEDRSAPLDELLRAHGPQFTPPPAARLQIACGEVGFLVGTTSRPLEVPRPALARLDDHWPWLAAGLGALLVMLLVSFLPPEVMSLSGELDDASLRRLPMVFIPPAPPPSPIVAQAGGGAAPRPGGGGAGSPTRHPQAARRPTRPRGTAPADIAHQGLLGALLAYNEHSSLAPLFSNDDKLEPGSFEGLIDGSGTGLAGNGIGLGLSGPGAGMSDGPLVGDDNGATIGSCDAACQSRTAGVLRGPSGQLRGHKTIEPQIVVESPTLRGSLDREIVRRIIRQHLNEVKYCYELQLPRHPDLAGRISVQFTIASGGGVVASLVQSSSLGNVAVESCIVQAVRRWEFPRRDSGMTIVSYPFVLVPAGAN